MCDRLPKLQYSFFIRFSRRANARFGKYSNSTRDQPKKYIRNCLFRLHFTAISSSSTKFIHQPPPPPPPASSSPFRFSLLLYLYTREQCPYLHRGDSQILMFDTVQWFHSNRRAFFFVRLPHSHFDGRGHPPLSTYHDLSFFNGFTITMGIHQSV